MPDLALTAPGGFTTFASSTLATSLLVFLAEFGDKSQLVCMTLAARHRGLPIVLGATCAFALLNLAAVLFGAAVGALLPESLIRLIVGLMFLGFGISSLRSGDKADEAGEPRSGHGLFFTTFLMIFVAEFGDKTQLAVAGMGSTNEHLGVWLGGTLALAATTLLGVLAGRRWLKRLPLALIHRLSGVLFLLFAALALFPLLAAL